MSGKKLYKVFINGEAKFTQAATAMIAAVAFKEKFGETFVNPNDIKEVKMLYFFTVVDSHHGYYKEVAAVSSKQACFLAGKYFGTYYAEALTPPKKCPPGTSLGDCYNANYGSERYFIANINRKGGEK